MVAGNNNLDEYERYVKSNKRMKPIKERLEEYIEFSDKTKRFSDNGFYRELFDYIESLERKIEERE